jgi:uncharacterized pyridoxamine 5'-phosphate oxidase family protein
VINKIRAGGDVDFNDCLDFASDMKMCFLATIDGDQPRVRAVELWFADPTGFYFYTGAAKSFYTQLKNNPKAELCFYKPGQDSGRMMRVTGSVEFLNMIVLKERLLAEKAFLRSIVHSPDDPNLITFRIAHGQAHFWTFETNLKPKKIIDF